MYIVSAVVDIDDMNILIVSSNFAFALRNSHRTVSLYAFNSHRPMLGFDCFYVHHIPEASPTEAAPYFSHRLLPSRDPSLHLNPLQLRPFLCRFSHWSFFAVVLSRQFLRDQCENWYNMVFPYAFTDIMFSTSAGHPILQGLNVVGVFFENC